MNKFIISTNMSLLNSTFLTLKLSEMTAMCSQWRQHRDKIKNLVNFNKLVSSIHNRNYIVQKVSQTFKISNKQQVVIRKIIQKSFKVCQRKLIDHHRHSRKKIRIQAFNSFL